MLHHCSSRQRKAAAAAAAAAGWGFNGQRNHAENNIFTFSLWTTFCWHFCGSYFMHPHCYANSALFAIAVEHPNQNQQNVVSKPNGHPVYLPLLEILASEVAAEFTAPLFCELNCHLIHRFPVPLSWARPVILPNFDTNFLTILFRTGDTFGCGGVLPFKGRSPNLWSMKHPKEKLRQLGGVSTSAVFCISCLDFQYSVN